MQEIDGSYFESFTALAWKQENQRQNAIKVAESSATEPPPQESDVGITPIDYSLPQNEKDKLYVEMLYTITNTVSWLLRAVESFKVTCDVDVKIILFFCC